MTKDDFFKPGSAAGKLSPDQKAERVDASAKGILSAESKARAEKTAYLRSLRLKQGKPEKFED